MTLRDDVIPTANAARQLIADLGFRRYAVTVRRVTWPGEPGVGAPVVEDLVISPPPKVEDRPERVRWAAPGTFEEGDRRVTKINPLLTRARLGGDPQPGEEWVWLLDDGQGAAEYTAATVPEQRNLAWEVYLRRRARPRGGL